MALLTDSGSSLFLVSISRFLGIILFFFPVEQGLVNISQQGRCCQAGHPDRKSKAHVRRNVAVIFPQRGAAEARPPARQVTGPGMAPADPPLAPANELRTAEAKDLPNSSVYPSGPPPTGRPLRKRVPLVELVLDFETAEHDGGFEAMANELGDTPADYYGRVIGSGCTSAGSCSRSAATTLRTRICRQYWQNGTVLHLGAWRPSGWSWRHVLSVEALLGSARMSSLRSGCSKMAPRYELHFFCRRARCRGRRFWRPARAPTRRSHAISKRRTRSRIADRERCSVSSRR